MSARTKRSGAPRDRTPFEIAILAVALIAIAGIVLGLLLSAGGDGPDGPELRATVRSTGSGSGGETFLVTVRNDGHRTAENVVVEVTVGAEMRETELLAVARRDEEHAVVVFPPGTTGPAQATVLSFTEPGR